MFTLSSNIGKENYRYLKKDIKKGCEKCPFKFCVGSNCRAYKKRIKQDDDEIAYIIKDKYKGEGYMNYKVEGNKGKRVYKLFQFALGFLIGVIVSVIGLILLSHII